MIHVPVTKGETFEVLKYTNLPIVKNGTIINIDTKEDFLIKGKVLHKIMTKEDLSNCVNLRKNYFCPNTAIWHKNLNGSCLGTLWSQNMNFDSCHVSVEKLRNFEAQINENEVLLFRKDLTKYTELCKNSSFMTEFVGLTKLRLKPGCQYILPQVILGINRKLNITVEYKMLPASFSIGKTFNMSQIDIESILENAEVASLDLNSLRLRHKQLYSFSNKLDHVHKALTLLTLVNTFLILGFLVRRYLAYKKRDKIKAKLKAKNKEVVNGDHE